MKRRTVLLLAALLNGFIAMPAFADGTTLGEVSQAANRSGDYSRQALVSVFGNVVNNPLATGGAGGGDTILASIFQVTNGGLLVVVPSSPVMCGSRSCRKRRIPAWYTERTRAPCGAGPARVGLASLVPTANGWGLAQLLMLWAASVMGVGLANMGTDAAIQSFSDGKGMVLQPAMPSTIQLARDLYQANLCMHAYNASLAMVGANGGFPPDQKEYVQIASGPQGLVLRNTIGTKYCGGADIDASKLTTQDQSTSWFSGGTIDTTALYQAHLHALSAMESALSPPAQAFVNAVIDQQNERQCRDPDAEVAIQSAAQQYEATIQSQAATTAGNIGSLAGQLSTSIKEGGGGRWARGIRRSRRPIASSPMRFRPSRTCTKSR
nr:hypothetical protein [Burkholderia gladioli]